MGRGEHPTQGAYTTGDSDQKEKPAAGRRRSQPIHYYFGVVLPRLFSTEFAQMAIPRILEAGSTSNAQPRSTDASPTRAGMSLSAKEDVQKLVATALKPHYHDQIITKDEYTIINRDVSRMLYDKIGDFEALDVDGKAKWEKVAGAEVQKAVSALKAQG